MTWLPRSGPWTASPDTLLILADAIMRHGYTHVVECGSGNSTLWMAAALKYAGTGFAPAISLEHDESYAVITRDRLRESDLIDYADVRYAPLEDGWYAREAWENIISIDLLLVDGPPGNSKRYARKPAFVNLWPKLLDGALVILDDTNRPQEKTILKQWLEVGGGHLKLDHELTSARTSVLRYTI